MPNIKSQKPKKSTAPQKTKSTYTPPKQKPKQKTVWESTQKLIKKTTKKITNLISQTVQKALPILNREPLPKPQVTIDGQILSIGNVYQANYKPKWANKFLDKEKKRKALWYYDTEPLILVLGFKPKFNLLLGINLHFLIKDERMKIISEAIKRRDDLPKLFTWRMLRRFPAFYHLPIAFRLYHKSRLNNITPVIDVGLQYGQYMDNNGEVDEARLEPIVRGMGDIHSKPGWTANDNKKLFDLASRRKNW